MARGFGSSLFAAAAARLCGGPTAHALAPYLSITDLRALRLTCRRGRAAFGTAVHTVRVTVPAEAAAAAAQAVAREFVNARRAVLTLPSGGELPSAALRALAGMPSLRELEVHGIMALTVEAVGFASLARLTALTFRRCALGGAAGAAAKGAAPALAGLPQLTALRKLALASCGLGRGGGGGDDADAAVLRALPPSLEELHLNGNPLGKGGGAPAALVGLGARLPQLTALRTLGLGGCSLSGDGAGGGGAAAAVLRALPPSLQALHLHDNPLGKEGGAAVLAALRSHLPQLTALRTLLMSDCSLGCDGGGGDAAVAAVAVVAVVRELPPSLQALHLSNNPLGNGKGAAMLAALCARLPQLTALRELGLHGCGLGSGDGGGGGATAAAAVLRALPPSLQALHLHCNLLGKEGGAAVLAALSSRLPQLTALRTLRMFSCNLGGDGVGGDAAVAAVLGALPPSLEELDLQYNPRLSKGGRAPALAALRARLPHLRVSC